MKVFSYVVHHDEGKEPNPYNGTCTLCCCKYSKKKGYRNIIELAAKKRRAKEEVWVIGTGGKGERSAGNGKLIYAMRIDQVIARKEFVNRFPKKNPKPLSTCSEKAGRFALISKLFWYFGDKAPAIPDKFKSEKPHGFKLEKKGPGFRCIDPEDFALFHAWLKEKSKPGRHGEPCGTIADKKKDGTECKSCC